jgi:hypothetical protein
VPVIYTLGLQENIKCCCLDLEKLVGEALSHITDQKEREKERAKLEEARRLTGTQPQTTTPTTIQTGYTNDETTNTRPPTTTTAKLVVFERTTTPSQTEESAIPEAESDRPEEPVHWATTMPGPAIKTDVVDLEPVSQTTVAVEQQEDNTVVTSQQQQTSEAQTELPTTLPTTQQQTSETQTELLTTLPTTQQQTSEAPPTTQQQTSEQPEEVTSTATPMLILTQQQSETNAPTTAGTAELLVPHHAANADSSETHPRTWKPRKGTTQGKHSKRYKNFYSRAHNNNRTADNCSTK